MSETGTPPGAYTVLLTANDRPEYSEFCEEVVCLAAKEKSGLWKYHFSAVSDPCDDGYFIRILSGDRFIGETGNGMIIPSMLIKIKADSGEG